LISSLHDITSKLIVTRHSVITHLALFIRVVLFYTIPSPWLLVHVSKLQLTLHVHGHVWGRIELLKTRIVSLILVTHLILVLRLISVSWRFYIALTKRATISKNILTGYWTNSTSSWAFCWDHFPASASFHSQFLILTSKSPLGLS
jgi:hypothetical protein